MSFLASKIYQCLLATNSRFLEKILLKIRAGVLKFANPPICLSYRGFKLKMPFSHTIFYFQKIFPNYDMQLLKIARYIQRKEGRLGVVDVGANIGDTCVFMRAEGAQFLLIEGEKSYANFIKDNIALNYGKNATTNAKNAIGGGE